MSESVTIVGAGLVGSLFAIGLAKRGHKVQVHEKRDDIRKLSIPGGRSINLVITSRGAKALQDVGLQKILDQDTVPIKGRLIRTKSGKEEYQPYGVFPDEFNHSISRGRLNCMLISEAEKVGAKFHFESEPTSIDFQKKTIHTQTESIPYQILIGADGAFSKTRKEYLKHLGVEDKVESLGVSYKELFIPSGTNNTFLIDKNALHLWPRGSHLLMALANLDGSFTVTLYTTDGSEIDIHKIDQSKQIQALFSKHYQDAQKLMPNLEKNFLENPNGHLGTVRCKNWTNEKDFILIGDAAHGLVPFYGQGMNSGFEDCSFLFEMLDTNESWESVFRKFNSVQRMNGLAIQNMALAHYHEFSDRAGDMEFIKFKQAEQRIEKAFPDLYRSSYSMVTYSLIPYRFIQSIQKLQEDLILRMLREFGEPEKIDLALAKKHIAKTLTPKLIDANIDLSEEFSL